MRVVATWLPVTWFIEMNGKTGVGGRDKLTAGLGSWVWSLANKSGSEPLRIISASEKIIPDLIRDLVPRTNNEEPVFSAQEGEPLTGNAVFISEQRVFALKRTADLRIEILNQVQNDGIPDEEPRTWTRSVGTKNRALTIFYSWA